MKEEDVSLLAKEEELLSLQTQINKIYYYQSLRRRWKKYRKRIMNYWLFKRDFHWKYEIRKCKGKKSTWEVSLKLKDCGFVYDDFEKRIDEAKKMIAFLKRKWREEYTERKK